MDGHRDVFIACSVGDLYWLKKSLPGREKLIGKIVNQEGLTPLHIAARHKRIEVLEYLLEHCHRVDTNIACYDTGETPLHSVLYNSDLKSQNVVLKCLKLLIQRGANCKKANRNGQTALHIAAQNGLPEIVKILLSNGADTTVKDFDDHTPYDLATLYGHHECSRLLCALHWAKSKDVETETQIQYKRTSREQKTLRKSLETELRKQEADEAYKEWSEQNRISLIHPPRNTLSRTTERTFDEKSNCQTCQSKLSGTCKSNLSKRILSAASNKRKPIVAKIDISLDQSDHNIESVGKPHKLYPYKNYPPQKYRKHKHHVTNQSRPNSSLTGRTRPSSQRSVKSVPTPRQLATPTPKIDALITTSLPASPLPHKPHTQSNNSWQDKDIHDKISHQSELMNTVESECLNGNHDNTDIQNGFDAGYDYIEKTTENGENEDEEEEGSSTSVEGLTFHEVGPENNLQTLITSTSGRQSLVNPADLIELLRLSQQTSHRRKSYQRFSSYSMNHPSQLRFQRRFSLGSIPEGKIYDKYTDEDEEGSRTFDEDFLFALMPYAFQGTEDEKEIEITEEIDKNGDTEVVDEKNMTLEVTPSSDYIDAVTNLNTNDELSESSTVTQPVLKTQVGSPSPSTIKIVTVAWDEDTAQVITNINEQELSPRKGKEISMTNKSTSLNNSTIPQLNILSDDKQSPTNITPSLPTQTLSSKSTYSLVSSEVVRFPNSVPNHANSRQRIKSANPRSLHSPKEKSVQEQSKRQAVKTSVYQFGGNLMYRC